MTKKKRFKLRFFWLVVGFVLHYIISVVAILTGATMTNLWMYIGLPFIMFIIGNVLDWLWGYSK